MSEEQWDWEADAISRGHAVVDRLLSIRNETQYNAAFMALSPEEARTALRTLLDEHRGFEIEGLFVHY